MYSQGHHTFLLLELPSFLARPNKLCSDDQNGYETLESLEECKMAANYLPKSFAEEQSSSRFPKGCYFSTIDNQVYYNSHSTGDKDFNARPICRAKGKEKILWYRTNQGLSLYTLVNKYLNQYECLYT